VNQDASGGVAAERGGYAVKPAVPEGLGAVDDAQDPVLLVDPFHRLTHGRRVAGASGAVTLCEQTGITFEDLATRSGLPLALADQVYATATMTRPRVSLTSLDTGETDPPSMPDPQATAGQLFQV
jgi:hypothetical protein